MTKRDDASTPPAPEALKLWGIWIPEKGWLVCAVQNVKKTVSFEEHELARITARRIGQWARAERMDDSLIILQSELLKYEKLPVGMFLQRKVGQLWASLKTWFGRRVIRHR
jgi:hypothetical protein